MPTRGRYNPPQPRHRARAGGLVIGGVEIISPRTKIHAESIFAGTLNTDLIKSLPASKTDSGTFGVVRIPDLSANKITVGTILGPRIGSLPTDRIWRGTFGAVRIPNLNASKINAGTINADRISVSGTITTKNLVVGALGKVKIQGALNNISVWDASNVLRVELGSLS